MSFLDELASNIRDARLLRGMTQRHLAQKVGVSVNCVSQYETARRMPSLDKVSIMSGVLDVSLDDLVPDVLACDDVDENQTSIYDYLEDGE